MDPSPGRNRRKQDPAELVEKIRELYVDGMTERQVASELGLGRNVVRRIIERYGIPKRRSWDYDRTGERNSRWRTENLRYDTLHARVTAARGKPVGCTQCGLDDPASRYEWANLTGDYANVEDYARMCVPCHRAFDRVRRIATGALTSPFIGRGSELRRDQAGVA